MSIFQTGTEASPTCQDFGMMNDGEHKAMSKARECWLKLNLNSMILGDGSPWIWEENEKQNVQI